LRKKCPQQKGHLESVVKGDPVKQKAGKGFQDSKERKDNPVHHPLDIVSFILVLNALQSLESWVDKANQAAKKSSPHSEKEHDEKDRTPTSDKVLLGNLGCFLWDQKENTSNRCEACGLTFPAVWK